MALDSVLACCVFVLVIPQVHLIVPPKTPVLSGFEPAAIGSNRELVCDASQPDAGIITYKWYKYSTANGVENWESKGPLGTGRKYVFNPVTKTQMFYPAGDNAEQVHVGGKYKCRASNSAGTRDSEWGDLYVYKPCPLYTASVSPAKPAIGSTFTLNCLIPNPSGFAVNWLKKTDALSAASDVALANSRGCHAPYNARYSWSSCSPQNISSPTKTFNLQVTNAQPADSAYWICKDIGLRCNSNPVKPVIQEPPGTPQIMGFPAGPVVAETQLNLNCSASPPADTYDWYKDGTKVSTSFSYDFHVSKESAGIYKCEASNDVGSATSSNETLVVYYKPDSVAVSSGKTSFYVGEKDKFTCTVSGGYPTPNVTIYFKRSSGTPVEVSQGQDRVMAKEDNQAECYCEAKVTGYPDLDMTSSRKTYNVTFPHTKVSFLNNSTNAVQAGQVKKFTCETDESNPITYIKWYQFIGSSWRDNTTGISSSERNGTYGGKIRISELSVSATKAMNAAEVRCKAVYHLTGHEKSHIANATIYVTWSTTEVKMVQIPSVPITTGVAIKCETDSSNSGSPGTISWYRNGQQITTGVTPSTMQASDGGTIYISQLNFTARKEDNQAKFECKINDQASFKKDVTITVYFPPNGIQLSETSITVKEGVTKTITCSTTSSSNPAVSGVSVKKKLGSSEVDVVGTSRATSGAYYGKDVSIDIKVDSNRKDNGAQYICTFVYASTTFKKTATVSIQWSATELKMVQKPSVPITTGVGIAIKCETDSSNAGSPGTVSWYRNGQQITTGVTPSTRQASDGGTIYISQLTFTARKEDNQAKFECKINDQARFKRDITIAVDFPPNGIQFSESSITVSEGVTKTITCSTTSSSNPAVSGVSVKKRLGSSEVDVTGTSRVTNGTYSGKDVSIDIKVDTNRKDNGAQYICTFVYASTTFKTTATVNIQFNPSRITMLQKPSTAIHEGKRITIVCETDSANPVADIAFHRKRTGGTWEQMTSGITSEVRAAEYNGMIRKSTLSVTANRLDNQAVFECEVKNGSFQVERTTTVNIYYPPTTTISSSPNPINEGDTLTLSCAANGGNPTSYSYKWFYDNREIPNETSKYYQITSIEYTHSGTYSCLVINYSPGGKADGSVNVDVLYRAKWNPLLPESLTVRSKVNTEVKFTLHVIANPPPTTVTWFHPNQKTAFFENFTQTKVNDTTYTLSKTSVRRSDYGNYTVNVTNAVGVSSFVFELKLPGPPQTPCCLKTVIFTAISATLTFESKDNGGSPQTFTIERREPGGYWVVAAKNIADPGFNKDVVQKIAELRSNLIYEFRIKAVNGIGESAYGNVLEVKIPATPNTTLTVSREGGIVTVTWTALIRSYSKVQIKYCQRKKTSKGCSYYHLKDPTATIASFDVNLMAVYDVYLEVFDGVDMVYRSAPVALPSGSGVNGGMIAGVVVTVVILIAALVAVVVMLHRRNMACFSGRNKRKAEAVDGDIVATASGPDAVVHDTFYMNVDNKAFQGEDAPVEPVYLNDPGNPDTNTEKAEHPHHEVDTQRVQEVTYDDTIPMPVPSDGNPLRRIEDISVADFKQWLLSKDVTESTYKCLAKNGFKKASIFAMLQPAHIEKLQIRPLGQEVLVQNLVRSFQQETGSESGRRMKPEGDGDGEEGAYEELENPYAELNITPDVIASQTYAELKP